MVASTPLFDALSSVPNPVLGLDAYGVIYNEKGPFDGIYSVIHHCKQAHIPVVMMTNNATQSVDTIYQKMAGFGLPMVRSHIISSGCGLHDIPELAATVANRRVFVYGYSLSHDYVHQAGGQCVNDPHDAQVMVLAAARYPDNHHMYRSVFLALKHRPRMPVICVNPDHYVRHSSGGLMPVMGFYAHQLAQQLVRHDVVWMGKPYPLFSRLVQRRFGALGLPTASLIFCDDNPLNVQQVVGNLNCHGVVITDTGVFKKYASAWQPHPRIHQQPFCKI
jgi:ribonucleotide monophosphatase NagD (HAD superfamily)